MKRPINIIGYVNSYASYTVGLYCVKRLELSLLTNYSNIFIVNIVKVPDFQSCYPPRGVARKLQIKHIIMV